MRIALRPNGEFLAPRGVRLSILGKDDLHLLCAHLRGLESTARHDRFNATLDDEGIDDYAQRCLQPGTLVIAAEFAGHVIGVAELHPVNLTAAEAALSVNAEWRAQGVGSALMALITEAAWSRGLSWLRITTNADNIAMQKLTEKFGAELTFSDGNGWGSIELDRIRVLSSLG